MPIGCIDGRFICFKERMKLQEFMMPYDSVSVCKEALEKDGNEI
jgi:hypothetical protein